MIHTECAFLSLPQELRDRIYSFVFEESPQYDHSGTRKAELYIYNTHVILHRVCPVPPPRWRGCRAVMRACRLMYHDVLTFLYRQIMFDVRISGSPNDPGPIRSRLTSEYPLGMIGSCRPLMHLGKVKLLLSAWSQDEIDRLKVRLRGFLAGIDSTALDAYIRSSDEIAQMLCHLRGNSVVEVHQPNRTLSEECLKELLETIGGIDVDHRDQRP